MFADQLVCQHGAPATYAWTCACRAFWIGFAISSDRVLQLNRLADLTCERLFGRDFEIANIPVRCKDATNIWLVVAAIPAFENQRLIDSSSVPPSSSIATLPADIAATPGCLLLAVREAFYAAMCGARLQDDGAMNGKLNIAGGIRSLAAPSLIKKTDL